MQIDPAATSYMRRALELAQLGWGHAQPNPLVGAVVVRDGIVVGEGYHKSYGGAHAEVEALRAAGDAARGATLYVTLEPCAHHGKTPPCTEAIIAAGISAVVYAADDPNRKAGGGAARLRAAGISVRGDVERSAARELNAPFFHVHEHGAPYVALKLALSLDGRIAAAPGVRTAITGPEAMMEVHRLRAGHDAILIGRGTAAADDPLLTVRGVSARVPPIRIVIDSDARLDAGSRLVQSAAQAPLWVVTADDAGRERIEALTAQGARVISAARDTGGVDLADGLARLAAAGVRTIFAEGGARIASALLMQRLVQRIYLFAAPVFLGETGTPAFTVPPGSTGNWRFVDERRFGPDVELVLERTEDG